MVLGPILQRHLGPKVVQDRKCHLGTHQAFGASDCLVEHLAPRLGLGNDQVLWGELCLRWLRLR